MATSRSSVLATAVLAAAVVRLAAAAVPPPMPVSDLREVRRTEVPPTLTVGASSTPFVFASEGAGVIYSLTQSGAVNVVDLATGELVRRVEQPPEAPVASQRGGVVTRHGDRAWLVTVEPHSLYDSNPNVIFDADDPRRPAFASLAPNCGGDVVGLPGVGAAVTIGVCAKIFGLDTGAEFADLFDGRAGRAAVGGDPSEPILALFLTDDRAGRSFYRFYRVADPRNPELLAEVGAEAAPLALWVDRRGEIVVDQDATGLIRIRAISGALLGTITGHAYGSALAFADGAFGRVLVVRSGSDWEFYDLADPTSPRPTGRFTPYWVGYPTEGPTIQRMVALATRPWLVVAHQNPSGVDVIDVRTGGLLDRYDATPTRPTALVADETVPTGPWVGVLGFEPESGARTSVGGLLRLDALRIDTTAHLEPLSSFSRANPDVVREMAPIDGRYVAMLDLPAGALAVGDTASGEMVAHTRLNPMIDSGGQEFLTVAGDTILAGTGRNLEVFGWTNGALVSRRFLPYAANSASYTGVALSASGAVALARGGEIRFFAADGAETRLPTAIYPSVFVEFSPDGDLLLASDENPNAYYSTGLTVWDVSDPHAPRRLWIGPYQVTHGRFARGGATVVADSYGSASYGVAPIQLEARAGRPLAPAGPWQGAYGPVYEAQSLIEGAEPRFTFVTHASSGSWFAVHFDPSFDTPQPLGDTGPYPFEPRVAPRADGKGWYEGFGDPSGSGPYAWQQFTIDGARGPANVLGTADLVPLRYGFFLAQARPSPTASRAPTLLRDVALDRPPRADAGPSRTVQCTGNRSAEILLDGTASHDPDSAPGTEDDLASGVWYDDGVVIGNDLRIEPTLALGTHDLRLAVTDTLGATGAAAATVAVVDTEPPSGGIVAPSAGSCFGPPSLPVTVKDDFRDVCDPSISRTYDPAPGPTYTEHGDYRATVIATDSSNNAASATVDFTIDTKPPVVSLVSPRDDALMSPGSLPFSILFRDNDDDGAAGGVIHEVVKLEGCPIFDGLTYGNGDGLLSDESITLGAGDLCRAAAACGFTVLNRPELRVEATDCGGNVGAASHRLTGSLALRPGICGN